MHRLVLADSGTLLLCSLDRTGHLAAVRRKLRAAFPGGPPKQSTIAVRGWRGRLICKLRFRLCCPRWNATLSMLCPKPTLLVQHASIARLLTPQQLSAEQIARVQAVCDNWSKKLRGQRFKPSCLHHVQACALGCVRWPGAACAGLGAWLTGLTCVSKPLALALTGRSSLRLPSCPSRSTPSRRSRGPVWRSPLPPAALERPCSVRTRSLYNSNSQ